MLRSGSFRLSVAGTVLAAAAATTLAAAPPVAAAPGATDGAGARMLRAAPQALSPAADPLPGRTLLTVRFAPGVRAAAATRTTTLSTTARRFAATPRSTSDAVRAATYAVPDGQAAAFGAALRGRADVLSVRETILYRPQVTPGDTQYAPQQRGYLGRIGAPAAWTLGRGSTGVTIAVVDSGVDVSHPDLSGKIVGTRNTHEDTSDVTDTVGHGTFVAGVAAAATDNTTGIAGVGWSTRLLAVKVADEFGLMTDVDVADGIVWAADAGAEIINLSLGSTQPDDLGRDAVAYARAQGALVVAAAGNSAQEGNPKMYPAAFPGVVAVGATNDATHRAWFSEHGSWVTLAAPGVGIRGTTPTGGSDMFAANYSDGDGTSFAAPIVAGAAALVWARQASPTAAKVRSALVSTAAGFSGMGLGAGEVRIDRAMRSVVPAANPTITSPADGTTHTGTSVTLRASLAAPGGRIAWYVDGTRVGFSLRSEDFLWRSLGYADGTHTVQARACSATRVCRTTGPTVDITLDRPAPVVSSPAGGASVTGAVAITNSTPALGALAAVVDGRRVAVDTEGVKAPVVNFSALTDGSHTVRLVECDAAGTRCQGPASAAVTVTSDSLHPTLAVTRNRSFNPGRRTGRNATTLRYTLDERQQVSLLFDGPGGRQRAVNLGTRDAGTYTYTWKGVLDGGATSPSATYDVVLSTSKGARRGRATTTVTVDRSSPVHSTGDPAGRFFPAVDGYRDTWSLTTTVRETATATLTFRTAAGRVVRRTAVTRTASGDAPATVRFTWNGRAAGRAVPAGRYTWQLVVRDRAGNESTTGRRALTVSRARLRTRTVTVTKAGGAAFRTGGTASCATPSKARSDYARGVWLRNDCARSSDEQVLAWYALRLPAGASYTRLRLVTSGRSHSAPVDVLGAVWSHHTDDYDYTALRPVSTRTARTLTLGSFAGAGHVANRWVEAVVYVPNTRAPLTDWDVRDVRLVVTYRVLR